MVPCEHVCYSSVAVSVIQVIVAGSELSCVVWSPVPPMDARDLQANVGAPLGQCMFCYGLASSVPFAYIVITT